MLIKANISMLSYTLYMLSPTFKVQSGVNKWWEKDYLITQWLTMLS